jgi:cobyrinic acid a,c-diamide synthase
MPLRLPGHDLDIFEGQDRDSQDKFCKGHLGSTSHVLYPPNPRVQSNPRDGTVLVFAMQALPRLTIAGLAGDTGKTLVCLGLIRAWRARGRRVAPFKKGPDFIDAAWLGLAAGRPGRNLDTFLMPEAAIARSLTQASVCADLAVIEGNRGLFDGLDARGSHSTAALARATGTPVVLVVDTTKVTRTVAALVAGCRALDPALPLGGVILNRVGTSRQEALIREAVVSETGLPVLGAIPRLTGEELPSRHLGLVTPAEHPRAQEALEHAARAVSEHVDLEALEGLAQQAPPLAEEPSEPARPRGPRLKVGVLKDRAFSFYYPENLEALEAAGAELVPISPLSAAELPEIAALYAGGGFPEEHAAELSANRGFREVLARRIAEGLPVWAECGGLMYLARELVREGKRYPMVGAVPVTVEQTPQPQGHGYVVASVDAANPFLPRGTRLRGHEFHYSRLQGEGVCEPTLLRLERGVGLGQGRDGIRVGNVVAMYTHLHALGTPEWASGMMHAAAGSGL